MKNKIAILGTGNIGCDLLAKVIRSPYLECTLFAGRNLNSDGMQFAKKLGIPVSDVSIQAIQDNPNCCDIVFDATTAFSHIHEHASILGILGKYTIDLTPSQWGKMCIPVLNMQECLNEKNVNLITCGGQATIPIINKIMQLIPIIDYVEIVASISSKSAGPGTRANIDEFTQTTKEAIKHFSGVENAKAIIILNPANPPIMMHNTIFASISSLNENQLNRIKRGVEQVEKEIQVYVPGYHITCGPVYENGRLTIMIEVIGLGDYLPVYSGNLDIITCAAVRLAEEKAKELTK
jgi:acetaldehyde dehydrogenase (acetylating)